MPEVDLAVSRRRSFGLLTGAALSLSSLLYPGRVDAIRGWCRRDPEFQIAGQTAHVWLAVRVANQAAARALSTGEPIALVLTVPQDISARYLAGDNGFGAGYEVSIEESGQLEVVGDVVPVQVAVYVPMTDPTVPVRIWFTPAGSARHDRAKDRTKDRRSGQDERPAAEARRAGDGAARRRSSLEPAEATGTANAWISFTSGA